MCVKEPLPQPLPYKGRGETIPPSRFWEGGRGLGFSYISKYLI